MSATDPLLDRILYCCRLSGGTMPIAIIVEDEAERRRGLALLRGRHNNSQISFVTKAESAARRARPVPLEASSDGPNTAGSDDHA